MKIRRGRRHLTRHGPVRICLDLAPIVAGATPSDAYRNTLDLARHAERLGYRRYWLAEHHGMAGVGSAAPAVLIAHVAAGTTTIRVGSRQCRAAQSRPLVVAEQFATLASLYRGESTSASAAPPAPITATMRALRRDPMAGIDDFPADLRELRDYFWVPPRSGPSLARASSSSIWLLGSSTYSAQLAAALGLPFAFASHFAPDHLMAALDLYGHVQARGVRRALRDGRGRRVRPPPTAMPRGGACSRR